jgi:hypothetical protein
VKDLLACGSNVDEYLLKRVLVKDYGSDII